MAVKVFNCNLNGGDAITANEDLTYRIYGSSDAYDTPIATAGSHNTDPNVTVTGDVVVITNVNVGSETSYKISSVDAGGNEAELSDAFSLLLLEDDFAGTVIDTGKWTVVHNNTSRSEFTQNDELIATSKATGTQIARTSWLMGIAGYDVGTTKVISFDVRKAVQTDNYWEIGFTKDITLSDHNDIISLGRSGTAGSVALKLREAASASYNATVSLDVSSTKTIKIIADTNVSFWYWNGASWTQLGVDTARSMTGTIYPFINFDGWSASSDVMYVDNLSVTDFDYSTQRPS